MTPEAAVGVAGLLLTVVGVLIGFAVKLILDRVDRMERDQGQRFDSLDRQGDRARERLHKIENWISARTQLEDVKKLLGRDAS